MFELIEKKVQQLSLLQVEIVRSIIPFSANRTTVNTQETLQSKIARREILLRQAKLTNKWITETKINTKKYDVILDTYSLPQELTNLKTLDT